MKHDASDVQKLAMWWHIGFCILNVGALLYHVVASVEHAREKRLTNP